MALDTQVAKSVQNTHCLLGRDLLVESDDGIFLHSIIQPTAASQGHARPPALDGCASLGAGWRTCSSFAKRSRA